MIVKARQDFKSVVAQAALERPELARAAGVSTSTIHALAHPEHKGRSGIVRESTAWKIARGFAKLTDQEPRAAFDLLFVEIEQEGSTDHGTH